MVDLLPQLSHTVAHARNLEDLARPLLEMLQKVTHLESTYLTRIDLTGNLQHVVFAHNTQQMQIPEGLSVAWEDTLCKRALDEQCEYTDKADQVWGDSQAAKALGIHTYTNTPVRLSDGSIYGTLCGASATSRPMSSEVRDVMHLFAQLISQQIEREQLLAQVQGQNETLYRLACTDALTGLLNRRAMQEQLAQMFALAQRQACYVLIGMVDMDGFKAINDQHGHEAGDRFLQLLSQQMQAGVRSSDVVARLGGDEFIFAGMGPVLDSAAAAVTAAVAEAQERLFRATLAHQLPITPDFALDYAGASVGVVAANPLLDTPSTALQQADKAMYQVKQARKEQRLPH